MRRLSRITKAVERSTSSISPPGALKQHVSCTMVVFWQLVWGLGQVGGSPPDEGVGLEERRKMAALKRERMDGSREDMMLDARRNRERKEKERGKETRRGS